MFVDTVMHHLRASAAKGDDASQHYLDSLKSAERFRIDNIADYIHETFLPNEDGPMDFDVPNEIPNIAPLADMMWFEMSGDLWERERKVRSGCFLVAAHDVREDGRDPSIPELARWIVIATTFTFEENRFFIGKTCHGFDGKPLTVRPLPNPFLRKKDFREIQHDEELSNLNPILLTSLFAICFCHCKNITVDVEKVSRQARRAAERAKEPVFTFKTINIHPVKRFMSEEGQVEKQGIKRALHICRAHFAHYTEEHPLFGKYTGTFYKPMHVRGHLKKGVVIKDYDIHEK
jgi:hypothetical protein